MTNSKEYILAQRLCLDNLSVAIYNLLDGLLNDFLYNLLNNLLLNTARLLLNLLGGLTQSNLYTTKCIEVPVEVRGILRVVDITCSVGINLQSQ